MRETRETHLAGIVNTQEYSSFPPTSILSHFWKTWPSSFIFHFHAFEREKGFFTLGKTEVRCNGKQKLATDFPFREKTGSGGAARRLENACLLLLQGCVPANGVRNKKYSTIRCSNTPRNARNMKVYIHFSVLQNCFQVCLF